MGSKRKPTYGEKQRFLYHIVTGNEKWFLKVYVKQRKEWIIPTKQTIPLAKQDIFSRKDMLCIRWVRKGTVRYTILWNNETGNADLYIGSMRRSSEIDQIVIMTSFHSQYWKNSHSNAEMGNLPSSSIFSGLGSIEFPYFPIAVQWYSRHFSALTWNWEYKSKTA